ncbi:MAG: response regulator, partial [Planctomycetes bacterium]|nr:response regulator [Planctomycetota bacterium]
LVVDDAKFTRNRISQPLEEAGFEVIQARNGEEGLKLFEEQQPQCILTDLLMPVVDGIEFITTLRNSGSDVPIVVVTADIQKTTREKCEKLGINGFLTKPFLPEQILEQVEQAVPCASL